MWIFFQRSRSRGSRAHKDVRRGFTIVELMVVISIMLVLTLVFLLRQQKFDSSTLLRSLGYSIALSIRQAQVYGSSILENTPGAFAAGNAASSYGVHFSVPEAYVLFADGNNNGQYTSGTDQNIKIFLLNSGYTIQTFCGLRGATMDCYTTCPTTLPTGITSCTPGAITYLTILFKRPNPDACFASSLYPTACSGTQVYSSAYLQIIGPDGVTTRSINATQTGAISVGAVGT